MLYHEATCRHVLRTLLLYLHLHFAESESVLGELLLHPSCRCFFPLPFIVVVLPSPVHEPKPRRETIVACLFETKGARRLGRAPKWGGGASPHPGCRYKVIAWG